MDKEVGWEVGEVAEYEYILVRKPVGLADEHNVGVENKRGVRNDSRSVA